MEAATEGRRRRIDPAMRQDERVSPLELFFDLVFVLALTQCTALMADNPTWEGVGQAMLILALLWWAWVGYSWMTSVVDPDDGAIRAVIFAAMGALLIVSICIPNAWGGLALEFALAYGAVRFAQIGVFIIASRDDPGFRRSTTGLGIGTLLGVALLVAGSFLDGWGQAALWSLALVLDIGEPYVFGSEGWKLEPAHFAERHALIILIALGESIVAIGVGAEVSAHDRASRLRRRPGSSSPPRCGGSTSTSSPSSLAGASSRPSAAGSRTRWRATPTPTCTS